jgi:hypothetical protein
LISKSSIYNPLHQEWFEIKGEAYKENLYLEAYGYRILSWMNKQEQKLSLIPNLLSLGRVCLVYRPGTKVIVK